MKFIFLVFCVFFGVLTSSEAVDLKKVKQTSTVFIQNKGQWDSDVVYLARIKGMNAWITKQGIRYDFHKIELNSKVKSAMPLSVEKDLPNGRIYGTVVDMECVGGRIPTDNPNGLQKSYYNYILGNDKSKWAGFVPAFNEIIRHDVYNGIDQRLYFDGGYMRYDFIVAPNGNSQDIVLSYKGAKGISINSKGELVLQTSIGEVVQQKLYAYQIVGNEKKQIGCSFVTKSGSNVGFHLDSYDHTKPLVIDPVLYSTYIGGADMDEGDKVVLDLAGNVIVAGLAKSNNLPVHQGSYDGSFNGERDAFIMKFTNDLSELIFCTYYGGSGDEFTKSCAVDEAGYIVFGGYTFSRNLPFSNGEFDHTFHGTSGSDGFVAKISYSGDALIYGAYLGGTDDDFVTDIALVPFANDAVVVGYTTSGDFPITPGALRTINTRVTRTDGFVTKISVNGSNLVFSTFLGRDSSEDFCTGVAIDKNNNPIVVGYTQNGAFSPSHFPPYTRAKISFPTTSSAFRPNNSNIDFFDGFLVKLGINGGTLDYSTLIGGSKNDYCISVDVDKQGIAAVCGKTESNVDFNPTAIDQTFGGTTEGFALRAGTTGGLYYSTYLGGGSDEDEPTSIKYYDPTGSVVVGGYTSSTDFPSGRVTDYGYRGGIEGFLFQINSAGNSALYSSFIGGSTNEHIFSIAVGNTGNVYLTGNTLSNDYPVKNGKFPQINGMQDGFVTAISTCTVILDAPKDTLVCPGKPITLTNNATGAGTLRYNWVDGSNSTTIGTTNTLTVTPMGLSQYYTLTVTDDNCPKTITYIVKTKPLPNINTLEEKKTCVGTVLKLTATADPTSTIAWYDAIDATTPIATGNNYTTPVLTKTVSYYVESQDTSTKCTSGRKQIRITVVPVSSAPSADNKSICANNSVELSAFFPSDVNFRWYDSLTGGRLIQVGQKFTTPKLTATTVYYLESLDTSTNCISVKRTPITVTILPSPNPIIQGQNSACVNSSGLIYSVAANPKRDYTWTITPNGTITNGLGTNKITVTWTGLGAGIISLKEKDQTSSCSKDTNYLVNISNELSFTLGVAGNKNLCTGDSVILDAGPGYTSYKWSSGETSQSLTVKSAGSYSVSVQDAGGCKGSSNTETITLSPRPTPKITGQNASCVNGSAQQYSVSPVAVNSYVWTVSPEGTIASGQGSTTITVNWTNAGTGTVKVTEISSNCTTDDSMKVVVSTSLSPKITPVGKTTLCEGENVVLGTESYSSYKWSTGETSPTITVTTAGSYTVEVSDASGCKGTSDPMVVTVSASPSPTITASGKTDLCEGDSVILDAGAFAFYLWSNGLTTQKITAKSAGKYSVIVTNSSGCKGTSPEQTVTVNPLPVSPVITQKGDDSLTISPYDGSNNYTWKLNGTDIGQTSEIINAVTEGNYMVEVTNRSGCKTTSSSFLYAKASSAVLTVSVSPLVIEAAAGETVRIPLVITSSKNLTQATASSFTAEISVEPSLLVPSSGTSTIVNNRRIITVNGTRKDGNDTLAIVEMKAGLGSVETSTIIVKSLVFQSGKAQVTTKDGEFRLMGICKDGGGRLYNSGSLLSLSMQPNPASDVLTMTITPSESGQHRIALTNTLGKEIGVLYNDRITGTQEITSSLADIPDGVYFMVLQSPTEILVKRVLIAK